jgi:hypothetical protein
MRVTAWPNFRRRSCSRLRCLTFRRERERASLSHRYSGRERMSSLSLVVRFFARPANVKHGFTLIDRPAGATGTGSSFALRGGKHLLSIVCQSPSSHPPHTISWCAVRCKSSANLSRIYTAFATDLAPRCATWHCAPFPPFNNQLFIVRSECLESGTRNQSLADTARTGFFESASRQSDRVLDGQSNPRAIRPNLFSLSNRILLDSLVCTGVQTCA